MESKRSRIWYLAIVGKLTKLVKVVKLFKFGKILLTFSSMILSILVYSFMLGPWFALGFVIMLFIHEMGHIAALRMRGYDTPGPVFIPMLGAVIFAPKFRNSEEEAFVGFAGPLAGGIAAVAAFGLWIANGQTSELMLLISYTAVFLNLFNLIPLRPLDGGRVMQIAGRWSQWIGFAALLGFTLLIKQPAIILIWILVLQDIKIKPKMKFVSSIILWVSMVSLAWMGYSHQPFWIDNLDAVLGGLFVLSYFCHEWDDENNPFETEDKNYRESLSIFTRLKWLTAYLVLGIALASVMAVQQPYLPHTTAPRPPKSSIS